MKDKALEALELIGTHKVIDPIEGKGYLKDIIMYEKAYNTIKQALQSNVSEGKMFKLRWLQDNINWDLGYYENEFMCYGGETLFKIENNVITYLNVDEFEIYDEKDKWFVNMLKWLYANKISVVNDLRSD